MTVTVQFDGDTRPTTFLLAQRGIADSNAETGLDIYPPTSPLGLAITGKFPGDGFSFEAPSGSEMRGRIRSAVPFRSSTTSDR